jgi:hypothetical protein
VNTLGLGLSNTLIKVLLVILGIASSIAVGLLTSNSPLMVIGIFGFLAVAILSFRRPEVATQAFIFLLYTNAASAAYKFHGVPFFVAALFPLVLALPFLARFLPLILKPPTIACLPSRLKRSSFISW